MISRFCSRGRSSSAHGASNVPRALQLGQIKPYCSVTVRSGMKSSREFGVISGGSHTTWAGVPLPRICSTAYWNVVVSPGRSFGAPET